MHISTACLSTFILTVIFVSSKINSKYEIISKERISNCKYLSFESGEVFKKIRPED